MMRWLKEKKKEKKTNSAAEDEDGKEDDYGFDKDKQSSKSPLPRRQLPPPPAAPEEKSPHIYEEIPDLYCLLDGGKSVIKGKGKLASKPSKSVPGQSSSYNVPSAEKSGDEINPYMVVAVDGEVRQTPTNFHRNGTPEVHCDVIVKDTHCEILLTRKPKVSAFRLDDAATSTGGCGGESSSGKYGLRNNTHFCSRDRRASVEVHSAGKLSSGFSASSSSAFSSSSRLPASTQSASNFSDLQPFESIQENDCSATSASNGVVTYSTGGNVIARATKLTFHPLGGKDPRKEAFGSDSSDDMQADAHPPIRDENSSACTQGVSYASVQEVCSPSKVTTYASLLDHNNSAACNAMTPKTIAENQNGDWLSKPSTYRHNENEVPSSANQNDCCVSSSEENFQIRTGVIRSCSPSYSSSCTYASVNFPTEAKIYNTIPDLIPFGYSENSMKSNCSGNEESSSFHCRYSRETNANSKYCDKSTNGTYSDIGNFGTNEPHKNHNSVLSENRGDSKFKHQKTLYRSDLTVAKNQTYASIDCDSNASRCSFFQMSQIRSRRSLDLDFCSCSDEHSSSCGCTDVKIDIDEDRSSVAGAAAAEGPNSCKGCGRIIRQITYSESFSDETSEHVYASRLLIRTGRRFSSPDITILESVNSEFQTRPHSRSPESLLSRDDTWAISRSDDTLPPAYGACDDNGFVSSYSEVRSLKRRDSDISSCRSPFRQPKASDGAWGQSNPRLYTRQNTCPSDNHSSMFCDTRDTIRNSSIFSAGRISRREYNHKVDTEIKANVGPASENQSRILTESNQNVTNVECDKDRAAGTQKTTHDFIEMKPNAFSGIFSKFTRQKVAKPTKSDPPENLVANPRNIFDEEKSVDGNLQTEMETQETNVKKFSKFFQRISSKESAKTSSDNTIPKKVGFDTDSVEQAVIKNALMILQESSPQLTCECPNQFFKELKNSPTGQTHPVQPSPKVKCFSLAVETSVGGCDGASKIPDQTTRPCTNMFDLACQSVGLTGNKTDSGDTCYEYDISTSSEGEQAGYDYVLSKVGKTLNLEQEVQQFADGGASRRKLLCKRCKRDENYSKIDSIEEGASGSSYGFCPHLSAKFGDLRAIFDDLVVDQRAAILDCLTDYAHSPYQLKGNNHENHCRECGCEVVTSDSESLTTLYSLLSQQLAMTSPNARTPSCESDEGTMADNSCESADEANVENKLDHVKHVDQDERNSSGYDEPDPSRVERAAVKLRKRDKKDKRNSSASSVTSASTREDDKMKVKLPQGTGTLTSGDGTRHGRLICDSGLLKHSLCNVNESLGGNSQKTKPKKTGVSPQNYQSLETKGLPEKEVNHSKICPVSRRRPGLISDKALQDIYAPLPSKALCLITSRNYGPNTGGPCTCGRENQTSSAIMASLIATANPPPPPTVTVKETDTVKPSPCPPLLDPNNGDGVSGVQTHSEHKNSGKIASVEFNFHKRVNQLDSGTGERWKMDVDPDNKTTVKGAVESTWMINSPAVNKGAHSPTKYGEAVSDNSITPHSVLRKHSRDAGRFEITDRCAGDNRDTVAQRGRNVKRETNDKEDQSPQLMGRGTRETADPSTLSSVEDVGKKIKLTRRHRLELASLDLLPETALCGDADNEGHVTVQNNSVAINNIKKSSVVEKMTKIFEERAQNKEEVTLLYRRKTTDNVKTDDFEIRHNRSRSREFSGTYRDSSNMHLDMRINCRESRSAHRDSSSTHKDSSSTHRDSSSTRRDSISTHMDSSSTHRDSSRTHRDSSSTHRDSSSTHRASSNIHKDFGGTRNDSSSKHRDSSSTRRESSSTRRESSGTRRESKTNVDAPCIVLSHIKENLKPTRDDSTKKKPVVGVLKTSPLDLIDRGRSAAPRNLCDIQESAKLNETSTDAGATGPLPGRSKTPDPVSRLKNRRSVESPTDGTRLKYKSREGKTLNGQTVKYRSSSLNLSEANGCKVKSPTPSLSSSSTVSSSSSLTKRKGNGRHKKLHKKSSDKKRSKTSRTSSGKAGERTRYYFSSDLSDIDVVEVDDWETYAKKLAPSNKNILCVADSPQSSSAYCAAAKSTRVDDVNSSSPHNRETPETEHERYEQEIYAIPPCSSELRNAREQSAKTTTSPQGSPELPKPRKAKRTELYKTKKSSNQLLSDLIIRNYDMQVYGNV